MIRLSYNDVELLPCPFCGAPADLMQNGSGDVFARCSDKNCAARTRQYHENYNGAVVAWNRRASWVGAE